VDVLVNNAAVQKNWRNPIKDPAGHDDRMYLHSTLRVLIISGSSREIDVGWSRGVCHVIA
jgi:hypothetical protein